MNTDILGQLLEGNSETTSNIGKGFQLAQSSQDSSNLISQALQSLNENSTKYNKKAEEAEKKAKRFSLIGNILGGIGALANTVNMSYQGIKHSRRGLPIGDPAYEFGTSMANQGDDLRKESERYSILGKTDPAQLLAINQAMQQEKLLPYEIKLMQAKAASLYRQEAKEKKQRELLYKEAERKIKQGEKETVSVAKELLSRKEALKNAEENLPGFFGALRSEKLNEMKTVKGLLQSMNPYTGIRDLGRGARHLLSKTGIGWLEKPLYTTTGLGAKEGTFDTPENIKKLKSEADLASAKFDVVKDNPAARAIENIGGVDAWVDFQEYNKEFFGRIKDQPLLHNQLQKAIMESDKIDHEKKVILNAFINQEITSEDLLSQFPEVAPYVEALMQITFQMNQINP